LRKLLKILVILLKLLKNREIIYFGPHDEEGHVK